VKLLEGGHSVIYLLLATWVVIYVNLILASVLAYRRGDVQRAIFWLVAMIALHQVTSAWR